MVDAVNAVSVLTATSRQTSRDAVTVSAEAVIEPQADPRFISSHIRVDNLQNIAILEYRSSEGEVVRQYPAQSHIAAFKRAEETTSETPPSTVSTVDEGDSPATPQPTKTAAPAPQEGAAPQAESTTTSVLA